MAPVAAYFFLQVERRRFTGAVRPAAGAPRLKRRIPIMPATQFGLRKVAATVLLLFALGASLSACADIHPDNTPRSPKFRAYLPY